MIDVLDSAEKAAIFAEAQSTYTPAYLAAWRHKCDPLADAAVASFANNARGVVPAGFDDLLSACEAAARNGDAASQAFIDQVSSVPDWVRVEDFELGHRLFRRNGVLTFLIGISVLVSSYGGYKDNKVLALSNRLGEGDAFRRAVETAQFTLDVTEPDGMRVGNVGWRSVLQVRLLHARVRQFCARGNFPIDLYDQPINQEAMCGAVMLFSHGVIRALEILGVYVSDAEKASYHALWRYAGWLMGVDLALLPKHHIGEVALFDLHQYDYQPDADTDRLFDGTVSAITAGARTLPLWMSLMGGALLRSRPFVENFVGYTVNDKLRDHLQLHPSRPWRLLFSGLQVGLGLLSALQRRVPATATALHRVQNGLMQRIVATLAANEPVHFNNTGLLA